MNKETNNSERVLLPCEFEVNGKYITDKIAHQIFYEDKPNHLVLVPSDLAQEEYSNVSTEEAKSIFDIIRKKH